MPTQSDPPTSRALRLNAALVIDQVRTARCRLQALALLWTKEVPQVPLILPEEPLDITLTPEQVAQMNRTMKSAVNQEYQELRASGSSSLLPGLLSARSSDLSCRADTSRAHAVLCLLEMISNANNHGIGLRAELAVVITALVAEAASVQQEFRLAFEAQEPVASSDLDILQQRVSILQRAVFHEDLMRDANEQIMNSGDEMFLYYQSVSSFESVVSSVGIS